ncbi:12935_t:CDS:2, partial [Ambispora gerdemannii]
HEYKLEKLLLCVRVNKENVPGKGEVSALVLELTRKNEDKTDVFYESLMDNKNLNKEFTITGLDETKTDLQGHALIIPREAYYNILPIESGEPVVKEYNSPSDTDIDNAGKDRLNEMVEEYNNQKQKQKREELRQKLITGYKANAGNEKLKKELRGLEEASLED